MAFPYSQALKRRQALAAIKSGREVYNSQGEAGTMLEITEHGYRWLRHGQGDTYTFPGITDCAYLSLTDPTKDN